MPSFANSRIFVYRLNKDYVFRRFTAGNYMLEMWQADQEDCQMAQG
jgi:hypothetical protein